MCHVCEECGQWCYCDQDDTAFDRQPRNCRHLTVVGECSADDYEDEDRDRCGPGPEYADDEEGM